MVVMVGEERARTTLCGDGTLCPGMHRLGVVNPGSRGTRGEVGSSRGHVHARWGGVAGGRAPQSSGPRGHPPRAWGHYTPTWYHRGPIAGGPHPRGCHHGGVHPGGAGWGPGDGSRAPLPRVPQGGAGSHCAPPKASWAMCEPWQGGGWPPYGGRGEIPGATVMGCGVIPGGLWTPWISPLRAPGKGNTHATATSI